VTDSELLEAARRVLELADLAADQADASMRHDDSWSRAWTKRAGSTRLYAIREAALHLRNLIEERIRQDREIRESGAS